MPTHEYRLIRHAPNEEPQIAKTFDDLDTANIWCELWNTLARLFGTGKTYTVEEYRFDTQKEKEGK